MAVGSSIEDITVVIPAAGRVPENVMALSNIVCPAMIPVAGRPVIYWTMNYLLGLGVKRFVIAVAARGMFIEDFVNCTFGQVADVQFIVPSVDRGVGGTLLELLGSVTTRSALTVLGDTHFQFADAAILERDQPCVLVHPVDESYRWCIADVATDGTVRAFHDKVADLEGPLSALIGVYYFPDAARTRDVASQLVGQSGGRVEMAQILEALPGNVMAVEAGDWLDCGNPDRQASSHQSLLQKRAFNELSVDSTLGTIRKSSHHVEKFINEINFLRLLPPEVAVLFPRVVNYSTAWQDPYVTMEYYGYPTLSEMFVFENVDPGAWETVFDHLRKIVTDVLMAHTQPLQARTVTEMYLDKTQARIETLRQSDSAHPIYSLDGGIEINGVQLRSLGQLWPSISRRVEAMGTSATGAITHGDLCFSNILYDLRSRVCKLIDPRGSFGHAGIIGDPRYDIAKLYHSVYGLYDFIVNDLFRVDVSPSGERAELFLHRRPQHAEVLRRFEHVFFEHFDRQEILLLTGLLFVSMPALHYDYPKRQLAMYVRGLQLLNESIPEQDPNL